MFYYEQGLFLSAGDVALDAPRPGPLGFISHAHADHYAAHGTIYCTRETAELLTLRFGSRRYELLEYGVPRTIGSLTCTALPAGHMLGSAMLLVEGPGERLLYTGDFRLRPSSTARAAEVPHADTLIMECTFGLPHFRFPPRTVVARRIIDCVQTAFAFGQVPVIEAYTVGKAQEVASLLAAANIPVYMDPAIYAASQTYQQLGCSLGAFEPYGRLVPHDAVILRPPRGRGRTPLVLPRRRREIGVTGWALDPNRPRGRGPEYLFPLSDHADYDELIECVERVGPRRVYCLHGQRAFVEDLRRRGWDAYWLDDRCVDARRI